MDQKERIIEQAMHMFVSQGIKSVRMDDIAQQLRVSKRTLYELFGDKEGYIYRMVDISKIYRLEMDSRPIDVYKRQATVVNTVLV